MLYLLGVFFLTYFQSYNYNKYLYLSILSILSIFNILFYYLILLLLLHLNLLYVLTSFI